MELWAFNPCGGGSNPSRPTSANGGVRERAGEGRCQHDAIRDVRRRFTPLKARHGIERVTVASPRDRTRRSLSRRSPSVKSSGASLRRARPGRASPPYIDPVRDPSGIQRPLAVRVPIAERLGPTRSPNRELSTRAAGARPGSDAFCSCHHPGESQAPGSIARPLARHREPER